MTIEVAAYSWVPPFAQGYVRDLRVRWALEEAGLPYEAVLFDVRRKPDDYPCWQPFNQVPAYREDGMEMFESGAIVLHIAEKSEALSPRDPAGRARTTSWVIAALNSVEPHMLNCVQLDAFHAGEPWVEARRPALQEVLEKRLAALADWLDDKAFLEERFTAGDLMMTCVLRELQETDVLGSFPTLKAYTARCEARPAFARALQAHMAPFQGSGAQR